MSTFIKYSQTLVLFKPDCVRRGLVGECLARFERRGFAIIAMSVPTADEASVALTRHYAEHKGEPYFPGLMLSLMSGPLIPCVLGGRGVVAEIRRMVGPYENPIPGTIRGDFATSWTDNVVHASDDEDAAGREVAIWFPNLR